MKIIPPTSTKNAGGLYENKEKTTACENHTADEFSAAHQERTIMDSTTACDYCGCRVNSALLKWDADYRRCFCSNYCLAKYEQKQREKAEIAFGIAKPAKNEIGEL